MSKLKYIFQEKKMLIIIISIILICSIAIAFGVYAQITNKGSIKKDSENENTNYEELKSNFQEIFTTQNILLYLLAINLLGFFIMWLDKRKARKGAWRIPEKTLFIITALGGGNGTIAGMYTFRHKTQKLNFVIGFPFITILEIIR